MLSKTPEISLWGLYPQITQSSIFFIYITILFLILRFLFKDPKQSKEILIFSLLGLIIAGVAGLKEYFFILDKENLLQKGVYAFESHSVFFGVEMMVGIFITLSLFLSKKVSFQKLQMVLIGLFLAATIVSFSRGVWISLLIGIFGAALMTFRNHYQKLDFKSFKLLAPILVLVLFVFSFQITKEIKSLSDFKSPMTSQYIRSLELKDGFNLFQKMAIPFGLGVGQLPFYFPQFRSLEHNLTQEWMLYPSQIRNNYLDLSISFGPIFIIWFILGQIFLGIAFIRFSLKRFELLNMVIFGGWLALLIVGFFYYYNITVWSYFGLFSAILLTNLEFKSRWQFQIKKTGFLVLLLIAIFIVGISSWILLKIVHAELVFASGIEKSNRISYFSNQTGPTNNLLFVDYPFSDVDYKLIDSASRDFQTAAGIYPFANPLFQREQVNSLTMKGRLSNSSLDKDQAYTQALQLIDKSVDQHPDDYSNYRLRASVEYRMALDNLDKEQMLNRSIIDNLKLTILDPSNPLIYDNLGLIYRQSDQISQATQSFEKAVLLKPDYQPALIHLGETYERQQKVDLALKIYTQALILDPQNQLVIDKIKNLKSEHNL